jgi:hypothetical protein
MLARIAGAESVAKIQRNYGAQIYYNVNVEIDGEVKKKKEERGKKKKKKKEEEKEKKRNHLIFSPLSSS